MQKTDSLTIKDRNQQRALTLLANFGFSFGYGGVHLARTMMLADLETLLAYIDQPNAPPQEYWYGICEENCLRKRSSKTRKLTYGHLVSLYALDPRYPLFRALRFFWSRDLEGHPLLALLCAYARDSILRVTAPFFLQITEETLIDRTSLQEYIDNLSPGRFSPATLQSTARNLSATWTQSGHLKGRSQKFRAQASPTAGSVSLALLLGYVAGMRGEALFQSEYAKLLDCSSDNAIVLAGEASRRGWLILKRVGSVIEVRFPDLLVPKELGSIYEQN